MPQVAPAAVTGAPAATDRTRRQAPANIAAGGTRAGPRVNGAGRAECRPPAAVRERACAG